MPKKQESYVPDLQSQALSVVEHSKQRQQIGSAEIERVLIQGDLSKLTPDQRVEYYRAVCESANLNPLTRPFEYITLNGKLVLYARKDATDQLRTVHQVSITIPAREIMEGVYIVTARATNAAGRADESTGAVSIDGLKGEVRANAMMKAETKAKRRVTLSICGLGLLDETEVETIPSARTWQEGKEAADAVARRKLDEMSEPPLPPDQRTNEPPRVNEPVPDLILNLWSDFEAAEGFDRLKIFAEMKKTCGEGPYYEVLRAYGIDHANQIGKLAKGKGAAEAVRIAKVILFEIYKRAAAQKLAAEPITLEDVPS